MKFNALPLLIMATSFFLLPPYSAQADSSEDLERFGLFTNCKKIHLVVEGLSENVKKIGLTEKAITNAVESRLRSAKLFSKEISGYYLYININVARAGFNIFVGFNKLLYDTYTGTNFPATTWDAGFAGTHGSDSGYIMSNISQLIDEFLVEYLRVNEKACEKK